MDKSISTERLETENRRVFPVIERKTLLKEVPSGAIYSELGADGAYIRFECDCLDALPYCKAQCCALIGTTIDFSELEKIGEELCDFEADIKSFTLKRDSDGFCTCLNRETRTCNIYEDRPETCRKFHCTLGVGSRGIKFPNSVYRQSMR